MAWARVGSAYNEASVLVEEHVMFARWVAWQYRRVYPNRWGDDIEAAAFEGLVRAARTFDPDRGVKFTSYAYPWMRGSVLNELRHLANRPRRVGVDVTVDSLAKPGADDDEDCEDWVGGRLTDWNANPEEIVCADLGGRQQVDGLLDVLDRDDRRMVCWYYFDGLMLTEIAVRLGMTESGACHKLSAIRKRLTASRGRVAA